MQRDHRFDFIKGVLIFLVVWGHAIAANKMTCCSVVFNVIYSFHMPLFVFISGYFALHTFRKNVRDVGVKVFNRLIVPALIWSAVALMMHLIGGYERGVGSMVIDSLRDVWFLYCIAFLYVLGSIVYKAGRWRYVVALSLAVLGYVVYEVPGVVYIEYFQPIRMWPLFVMGLAYSEYKQKIMSQHSIVLSIASILTYAGLMLWLTSSHSLEHIRTHENYLLRALIYQTGTVAWFVLLSSLYSFVTKFQMAVGVMSSLGRNTLGIYVIHGKILLLIIMLIPYNVFARAPSCITAILLTSVTYLVTLLLKKSQCASKYLLGE